ncbi:cation transporter [candidate division KSB1 bacterium]|nr:cation transporter [candidate division KSB1 bacterium]
MSIDKKEQPLKQIRKITWIGIFINLALSVIKFIVGYLGRSQAVIADAFHSISDLATDFAVIVGVKFWSAPPDEEHPYGHRRIEALITTAIGIVLAFVAIGISYKSLSTIREAHIEQTGWVAVWGPFLSIFLKEILYRWTVTIGIRVKSTAVIANAWHHRSDALSSLPALIAVIAASLNPDWAFFDHIGALIVSLFILKVSWDIVRPSIFELVDRGASRKERELIKQIVMAIDGVKDVHAIRTRKFGQNLSVDLHILVEPEITVRTGHDISEKVQDEILKNGPNVLDVVVHIEPFE